MAIDKNENDNKVFDVVVFGRNVVDANTLVGDCI